MSGGAYEGKRGLPCVSSTFEIKSVSERALLEFVKTANKPDKIPPDDPLAQFAAVTFSDATSDNLVRTTLIARCRTPFTIAVVFVQSGASHAKKSIAFENRVDTVAFEQAVCKGFITPTVMFVGA